MQKYTTQTVGNVIIGIGKKTEIEGYTETIIESSFPDEEILEKFTKKQERSWIKENNHRMNMICEFMNKNNL